MNPEPEAALTREMRERLLLLARRDRELSKEMSAAQRVAFKARGNRRLAELGFGRQTRAMRSAVLKARK